MKRERPLTVNEQYNVKKIVHFIESGFCALAYIWEDQELLPPKGWADLLIYASSKREAAALIDKLLPPFFERLQITIDVSEIGRAANDKITTKNEKINKLISLCRKYKTNNDEDEESQLLRLVEWGKFHREAIAGLKNSLNDECIIRRMIEGRNDLLQIFLVDLQKPLLSRGRSRVKQEEKWVTDRANAQTQEKAIRMEKFRPFLEEVINKYPDGGCGKKSGFWDIKAMEEFNKVSQENTISRKTATKYRLELMRNKKTSPLVRA